MQKNTLHTHKIIDSLRVVFSTRLDLILICILFLISFIPRFVQLGYSEFYGDETKTFYLDKTIPAQQFFLDQRKGPMQFLVVWFTEKLIGGHDQFYTRLPFAIAGLLSVFGVYFFIKLASEYFNSKSPTLTAFMCALLFSINGFFIAFSRTIQYQSFLLLFGTTSLCFVVYFLKTNKLVWLSLSAVLLSLAFLTHYDAASFFIVAAYLLITHKSIVIKPVKSLTIYILIFLMCISIFYIPYLTSGYFTSNTSNYLLKRVSGDGYLPNSSLYTMWIYNPSVFWVPIVVSVLFILWQILKKPLFSAFSPLEKALCIWLAFSFVLYGFVFSNPGTHILMYVMPVLLLSGIAISHLHTRTKFVSSYICSICVFLIFATNLVVYIPAFNTNYPWQDSIVSKQVDKNFNLFLYGFPYKRGWSDISAYFKSTQGVRGFYTNDNVTMAQYYLHGIPLTPPGSNFLPQYYIDVFNNQETAVSDVQILSQNYTNVKDIYVDTGLTAKIYKLKK